MSNCARLYNAALEEWRTAYRQAGVSLTMYDQMKELARFGGGMVDAVQKARGGGLIVVDETVVDDAPVSRYGADSCARHDRDNDIFLRASLRSSVRSEPCQARIGGGG